MSNETSWRQIVLGVRLEIERKHEPCYKVGNSYYPILRVSHSVARQEISIRTSGGIFRFTGLDSVLDAIYITERNTPDGKPLPTPKRVSLRAMAGTDGYHPVARKGSKKRAVAHTVARDKAVAAKHALEVPIEGRLQTVQSGTRRKTKAYRPPTPPSPHHVYFCGKWVYDPSLKR